MCDRTVRGCTVIDGSPSTATACVRDAHTRTRMLRAPSSNYATTVLVADTVARVARLSTRCTCRIYVGRALAARVCRHAHNHQLTAGTCAYRFVPILNMYI